jgi:DNA-binding HxlR family transcriptional regulator
MNFRSTCPVSNLLDIVGDKWSILIIRDLFIGRNTFSEILKSPEKISTNILVDRLKKLVSSGLIKFYRDPNDKKIKVYSLTSKGIDLYPVLVEMALWSRKNLNSPFHPIADDMFKDIDSVGVEIHINNVLKAFNS